MDKPVIFAIVICAILVLSLCPFSIAEVKPLHPTTDGDRIYVENEKYSISASPHTLTADGYVYFNVTSKAYQGDVDFCLGFNGSFGYPTSLELYEPREEVTQHNSDLNPYFDDPACRVEYNYTTNSDKWLYDGYVWVDRANTLDEKNQTINSKSDRVLLRHFDAANMDTRFIYWNTSESIEWREIGNHENFNNVTFDFQGMNTWYLSQFTIEQNKNYYLRMWLTIVPAFSNEVHEFYVGFKPTEETLEKAVANDNFYFLDPWYSSSWAYRKAHIINNAAGAGTNYQVRIVVHRSAGTDSGQHVYVSTLCKSDFSDIRFTDNNGATVLDYWRESVSGNEAVFWVEIQDDLSITDAIIYMYYGNAGASTTSNFDNTFPFGEPFDSGTLSTYRWPTAYRTGNPTYWIDSTYHFIEVSDMDTYNWWNGRGFRSKQNSLPDSWIIESAYGVNQPFWFLHYSEVNGEIFGGLFNIEHGTYSDADYGVAFTSLRDHWVADKNWINHAGVGGNVDYDTGEQVYSDYVLKNIKMWKLNGNIYVSIDGTVRVNEYNTEPGYFAHLGIARHSTYGFGVERFYAFKIRNYVSPEPAHGSWGPQQQWSTWPSLNYASLIWGTGYYPSSDPNLGGQAEKDLSESVCNYVYNLYATTGRYDRCNNYWGSDTQPENVYNAVYDTENNRDYTTVFYKGHIYPNCGCDVPNCQLVHNGLHDWESGSTDNVIKDWEIYERLNRENTGLLFLWACGHADPIREGGYEGDHSWGMIASWMGTLDLVYDGYTNTYDTSDRCFISFVNVSINFIESTEYGDYQYAHFASLFYYYALSGGTFSVKNALDLAASDTHSQASYGACQLHTGYWAWDGVPGHDEIWSYMRTWGDTDHVIPS